MIKINPHLHTRIKINLELNELQDFVLPESQFQDGDGGAAAQDRGVAVKPKPNYCCVALISVKL